MFQWRRLASATAGNEDAAGTNSSDTTEVQVGGTTGLTIPNWAKSIHSAIFHTTLLALTTTTNAPAEWNCGYWRLANDQNTLDPLNFPIPPTLCLTGAIGTHVGRGSITVPVFHDVTPNDILRCYAAWDDTTTGVHTFQCYVLFSSESAPFQLKAQKSALITSSTTANTASTAQTIDTVADKTNGILGFWNYLVDMPTAAQTAGGFYKITSNAQGWVDQRLPTNMSLSGLSTQITPFLEPIFYTIPALQPYISGAMWAPFPTEFPLKVKETFNCTSYMDGTNTVAPIGRVGLIWKEK